MRHSVHTWPRNNSCSYVATLNLSAVMMTVMTMMTETIGRRSYRWRRRRHSSQGQGVLRRHSTEDIGTGTGPSERHTRYTPHQQSHHCRSYTAVNTADSVSTSWWRRGRTQLDTSQRTGRRPGVCQGCSRCSQPTSSHCMTDSSHHTANTDHLPRTPWHTEQSTQSASQSLTPQSIYKANKGVYLYWCILYTSDILVFEKDLVLVFI